MAQERAGTPDGAWEREAIHLKYLFSTDLLERDK